MKVTFKRILKASWQGFMRNKGSFLATIFVMVIAASLVGGMFVMDGVVDHLVDSLQKKVDISVYFKSKASPQKISDIQKRISEFSEVKKVEYVSREEALTQFKKRHKEDPVLSESLEELGFNPLLPHLNIKAWQASQYQQVSSFLENGEFGEIIDKVDYHRNKEIINRLFSITSTIKTISWGVILVSVVLAILVGFNTIRLTIVNCKEEISIQRLVGASNWFIRGPFVIQGIISGVLASVLGIVIFGIGAWLFTPKLAILVSDFNLMNYFLDNIFAIVSVELITAVGLGVVSSWIASRKYLKI